jgi:hypothetical protein
MPYQIGYTPDFLLLVDGLSDREKDLIDDFIFYFEKHGLKNFTGKKCATDNIPKNAMDRAAKIAYARQQQLWHVHIGYRQWHQSKNPLAKYKTSRYVVHFQKFSDTSIALVDYGDHTSMHPPKRERLFKQM